MQFARATSREKERCRKGPREPERVWLLCSWGDRRLWGELAWRGAGCGGGLVARWLMPSQRATRRRSTSTSRWL